ncbi:MAG: hypothetical protein PHI15_08910 [Methanomicrobium sp.]|nr:hypothetical protein [Methanomicrobium sp.]
MLCKKNKKEIEKMNRIKIWITSILLISVCLLICGFPASADDKITLMRPIPDELSQNDTLEIFYKSSYSEGSFISYNFTLDTPYPHRGKISGKVSTGSGSTSGGSTFAHYTKISLGNFIPGDWNLTIWEESNSDKAYSKIIHIYPAGMEPKDEPVPPDFCNSGYKNLRQNFKLSPEPDATGGIFAKGQPLYLAGTGLSGTKTGVWIYQETDENKEAHFKALSTDCNGEIMGNGEILSAFNSYNMPSGRYCVYTVSGDFEYTDEEIIPSTYTELENAILQDRDLQYQKFTFFAEEPEISITNNIPKEIQIGTQLKIDGKTNLKSGAILEIVVSSSAVDYDSYQGIIVLQTEVFPYNNKNRWESVIDTSLLGPGEYTISIESPEGLGQDSITVNTYNQIYSVSDSSKDVLSKITYDVDKSTKSLKDKTQIQNIKDYSADHSYDFAQDYIRILTCNEIPKTTFSGLKENILPSISLIMTGGL